MSNTRRAHDGRSHQNRFCSAPEFEGDTINGLLAAKRIALIEDASVREILWFIQWRSLESSGLQKLCREVVSLYPERLTAPTLSRVRSAKRTRLRQSEIEALRVECRHQLFEITDRDWASICGREYEGPVIAVEECSREFYESRIRQKQDDLPDLLKGFCLDPSQNISDGVWFFADLVGALRAMRERYVAEARTRLAETSITRQVNAVLNFCADQRRMVLIEGVAGIGRTATLRAWSDSHAGLVRYVETPSSNDDRSFYANIAQSVGVARGLSFNLSRSNCVLKKCSRPAV